MRLALVTLVLVALGGVARGVAAQDVEKIDAEFFDQHTYRCIGPVGNCVSAVTGVPGYPNVCYIGAASGGVFKTTGGPCRDLQRACTRSSCPLSRESRLQAVVRIEDELMEPGDMRRAGDLRYDGLSAFHGGFL